MRETQAVHKALLALFLPATALLAACNTRMPQPIVTYDVVILNGRVMDPASGLDSTRNVGISGDRILAVTSDKLQGRDTINATGMVVSPGFIDLHQHAQHDTAYRIEALDGTTTALELEEGTADVDEWYRVRAGKTLINYGVSAGHQPLRSKVMGDTAAEAPQRRAKSSAPTEAELAAIVAGLDAGLRRGAVAVGMEIEFTPGARPWEIYQAFKIAAAHNAGVHVHMRATEAPAYFLETEEVIAAAAITGTSAHIVHIQSSGGEDTPQMLEMVLGARAHGVDVTAEVYPYTASMSPIEGAEFDEWASWPATKFKRYEWPPTGERLTRESFARYRKQGGYLVDYNNSEVTVSAAVAHPLTMIASDGILHGAVGHPRVAGTFARVLGKYVRETHLLTLMDALRKITIDPARRLERRVPAMARKGRVQVGADADIVVFDAVRVLDKATYRQPTLPPVGIRDVLINGVLVVRNGALTPAVLPGRPVRAEIK